MRRWILPMVLMVVHSGFLVGAETLQQLVNQRQVACNLTGDGSTTNKARLSLFSTSAKPLTVEIPGGQVFLPQDAEKNQYMMTTEPRTLKLPPGQSLVEEIPTICASPKSIPPPGPTSIYKPGKYPDPEMYEFLGSAISIARQKEDEGLFQEVPIPEERRASTISQLAIWMMQADLTKKPQDQVNKETIANDFLSRSGTKRESLSPEQQEKFDDNVAKIFEAADLTRKQAQAKGPPVIYTNDGPTPEGAGKPKTPLPETTTGPGGEDIVTEFHPGGKVQRKTTTYPPTPGGDPRDPSSETQKTEEVEYAPGEKLPTSRTVTTDVNVVQGLDATKLPKKRTIDSTIWSRDPKGKRYVAQISKETWELEEIDAWGVKHFRRERTTTHFSGPADKKGTTTRETYDPLRGAWVPKAK